MVALLSDKRRYTTKVRLALYLTIPLVIFCIPIECMQNSEHSICLSRLLFDRECFGCGMTRAVISLIHGNIQAAWEYNNRSFIVVPLLAYEYSKRVSNIIGTLPLRG